MLKRFALLFVLLPTLMWAQSTTPNIGLQIPATGSNNWYIPLNFDFSRLDLYLSGNAPIPALSVTGNVTIGGTLTAGQITGAGGSIFATAANALQYSPVYYSRSPNGTAFAGVAPFTGFAYFLGNAPPRAGTTTDVAALLNGAGTCGTGGAYSPSTNGCIAVGSGTVNTGATGNVAQYTAAGTAIGPATGTNTFLYLNGSSALVTPTTSNLNALLTSGVVIGGGTINGTSIGATTASTGAFTVVTATGNLSVQGLVSSTANTSPASITNSGVALSASPTVGDVVYYDSAQTANNRVMDAVWISGSYQQRFKNDAQSSATPFFTATGGFAGGITALASNSGSGSFTHNSIAQTNTIFASSSSSGTSISIQGTGTGVNDWRLLSDNTGKLEFNVLATNKMTLDSTGALTTIGNIIGSIITANSTMFIGGGAMALYPGGLSGGINALCLSVSSGCASTGSGNFNGIAVDTTNFPNRVEFNALNTFQFFVNNGTLGPNIKIDGTLDLPKPLSITATGIVASAAKPSTNTFPIIIGGVTYYMLLSTSP